MGSNAAFILVEMLYERNYNIIEFQSQQKHLNSSVGNSIYFFSKDQKVELFQA